MKYKVKVEFLPGVTKDQECEVQKDADGCDSLFVKSNDGECYMSILEIYAKQHPEIFQPIVEPVELKENETEFVKDNHIIGYQVFECGKCKSLIPDGNFCANCGRKRKI